jgi:hypothetical protein
MLAEANSSWDPTLKKQTSKQKTFTKKAAVVAQGIGPEFKPSTTERKKKLYSVWADLMKCIKDEAHETFMYVIELLII